MHQNKPNNVAVAIYSKLMVQQHSVSAITG